VPGEVNVRNVKCGRRRIRRDLGLRGLGLRGLGLRGLGLRGLGLRGLGAAGRAVALVASGACGGAGPSPAPGAGGRPSATASGSPSTAPVSPAATPATSAPAASATAVSPVAARLAGRDWTVIPTSRRVVALTFDAGANDAGLASILATLRRTGVPATFFLTGTFTRSLAASARRIAAGGYRIGDHTLTHPHLTQLSDAAVRQEILGGARQIAAVTGAAPAPLLRFPFGDADQRVITLANQAGFVPVRWTVDSLGWEGKAGGVSAAVVTARVLGSLRPGEIVLMHIGSNPDDGTTFDADALPQVISQLRARGYSFVTMDALVG
jgi:peptidoglycan/xylan/chitin deacetylase (PgdA/CDA1 family)